MTPEQIALIESTREAVAIARQALEEAEHAHVMALTASIQTATVA